jgi:hypothetical protein
MMKAAVATLDEHVGPQAGRLARSLALHADQTNYLAALNGKVYMTTVA